MTDIDVSEIHKELFVYLGKYEHNLLFFRQVQDYTSDKEESIIDESGQIYNCLIQETLIHKDDGVVVFNILPSEPHIIVAVSHASFKRYLFAEGVLKAIFFLAVEAFHNRPMGEESFVIDYNGEYYRYLGYNVSDSTISISFTDAFKSVFSFKLANVRTTKPILYDLE